jgi:hypothetical protein
MTPTLHNAADILQMILGKIPRHSIVEEGSLYDMWLIPNINPSTNALLCVRLLASGGD